MDTLLKGVRDPDAGQNTTRDWAMLELGAIAALVLGVISSVVIVVDMLR